MEHNEPSIDKFEINSPNAISVRLTISKFNISFESYSPILQYGMHSKVGISTETKGLVSLLLSSNSWPE